MARATPTGLDELIDSLNNSKDSERADMLIPKDMYAARLRDYYAAYQTQWEFAPGDLVESKPGLGTIITMESGYPAIITRIYAERQHAHDSRSSTDGTFHNCNVLIIGTTHAVEVSSHTSKFQPYRGPVWQASAASMSPAVASVWNSANKEEAA